MKTYSTNLLCAIAKFLQALSPIALFYLTVLIFPLSSTHAQHIWEPEGLNMPGAWNGWVNPPVNNLALASSTQVPGGRVTKISTGITRWQTIFRVAASGGDLVGGNYNWLFTSGPAGNPWMNKWAGVNVVMNTLQTYTYNFGADNNITIVNGRWYSVVWRDSGYGNTQAIFMETSANPVTITSVSSPAGIIVPNQQVPVTVSTSSAVSPEEIIYVRYTTNSWITSSLLVVNMSGNTGTATIPGQPEGTTVAYYAFSSTVNNITANFDLFTIHLNNNQGNNYTYLVVGTPPPMISWANLQSPPSGSINPGQEYNVSARVFADGITNPPGQGGGIQAWIGYSTSNTHPSTWTNWIVAGYLGDVASIDEYMANLGAALTGLGTFYYASRFQLSNQAFVYGGYSAGGGGFWDGSLYVSGIVDVIEAPAPEITFANLQFPPSAEILIGGSVTVYAQTLAVGVALTATGYEGLTTWIGYSNANTHPSTWTNWYQASYGGISGYTGRPEYLAQIGSDINTTGTYYYATRFQLAGGDFVYGGYSAGGGGFWNGTDNISGVLTVIQEIVYYAVVFTVIDETESYQAIEFKGQMTDWAAVPMVQNPEFTWTLTLVALPGTYEWGALENDGSEFGIWLIEGPNLEVTIGFDGTISGVTTYTVTPPPIPQISWANLQHPPFGNIEPAQEFNVFGRAWINGVTGTGNATVGLQAWVGYHIEDTHPVNWTNWIPAAFHQAVGNNDEFIANLGQAITTDGTYHYAYRYQYLGQDFVYGGFSEAGGGLWEAGIYTSGVLTVTTIVTPENRIVDGLTIGNDQTECFDATNNITVSNTIIMTGATVEFRAGVNIIFLDGFVIEPGASVHAMITDVYCQPGSLLRSGEEIIAEEIFTTSDPESVFSVFPNPNTGRFKVRLNSHDYVAGLSIEVFNLVGERISQTLVSGRQEYEFDLTNMPSGVYILRLVTGNKVATERVIKH